MDGSPEELSPGVTGRIRLQREGFRGQIPHIRFVRLGAPERHPGRGKYRKDAPFEPDPAPPRL